MRAQAMLVYTIVLLGCAFGVWLVSVCLEFPR